MQPIAVAPSARVLNAVVPRRLETTTARPTILTRKVASAATIMAGGPIRAARATTAMLIPKNPATTATPIRAPTRPFVPTRTAQSATRTAAPTTVGTTARRTTVA